MNPESNYETILSQMNQPAFLVQNGVITALNSNAANHFAEIGMDIGEMLITGIEEYSQLTQGSLYLTIEICGTPYPCCVSCLENAQLFTLELDSVKAELQVLSLAAQQLSFPISELSVLFHQLEDVDENKKAQISQSLFRLRRLVGNMADASRYATAPAAQNTADVTSLFGEILEKAQTLLSESGIKLSYTVPKQPIYSQINQELIRRAVYNLLSNGAKFSDQSSNIDARLTQNGNKLYFTVSSKNSSNILAAGNLFNRYTRQPGLEERKYGLGLGMALIHAAAMAHNGTVLIQQYPDEIIRITMTISITKGNDNMVRSPQLFPDIYGGNDQALIELSDVLSSDLYK